MSMTQEQIKAFWAQFEEKQHIIPLPDEASANEMLKMLLSSTEAIEKEMQSKKKVVQPQEKVHALIKLAEKGHHRVVEQKKLALKTRSSFTTVEEYQQTLAQLAQEKTKKSRTSRAKYSGSYGARKVRDIMAKLEERSDNEEDPYEKEVEKEVIKKEKQSEPLNNKGDKVYLPTIVDPFAKSEEKDSKVHQKNRKETKIQYEESKEKSKPHKQKKSSRHHAPVQDKKAKHLTKKAKKESTTPEIIKTASNQKRVENVKTEDSKDASKIEVPKVVPPKDQAPTVEKRQISPQRSESPMFLKRRECKPKIQIPADPEDNFNQLMSILMKDQSQQDAGTPVARKQQAKVNESDDDFYYTSPLQPKQLKETKIEVTKQSEPNQMDNHLKELTQKMRKLDEEKQRIAQQQREIKVLIQKQEEIKKQEEERRIKEAEIKKKYETEQAVKKLREEEIERKMLLEAQKNRQQRERREKKLNERESKANKSRNQQHRSKDCKNSEIRSSHREQEKQSRNKSKHDREDKEKPRRKGSREKRRDSRERNRSRDHNSKRIDEKNREGKQHQLHEKRERKNREDKHSRKQSKHRSRSSSLRSSSSSKKQPLWKTELQKITGYNPQDARYRKRDKQNIYESGFDEMTREELISRRRGMREEDEQLEREFRAERRRRLHHDREY